MALVAAAGSCALGGTTDWMMPGARCGPSSSTTPAAAAALQTRSRCAARDRTSLNVSWLPASAHLRDVGVDHLPQNRQRHGSGPQQQIMESAQRKSAAQCRTLLRALGENLHLPDFIRTGLSRHHDVALNFGRRYPIIDGLLAGPVLGVQAGIDHQAASPEQLVRQLSQVPLRIAAVPAGAPCLARP